MHIDIKMSQATSRVKPEAPKGYDHISESKPLFDEVQNDRTLTLSRSSIVTSSTLSDRNLIHSLKKTATGEG